MEDDIFLLIAVRLAHFQKRSSFTQDVPAKFPYGSRGTPFTTCMKHYSPELRKVDVTRYVTPLREGGSLPAIVEADDEFLYVLKFRGAGQGIKALMAEIMAGELARVL